MSNLPFTGEGTNDQHGPGVEQCSLQRLLPPALQERTAQAPHLLEYLHQVPVAEVGIPVNVLALVTAPPLETTVVRHVEVLLLQPAGSPVLRTLSMFSLASLPFIVSKYGFKLKGELAVRYSFAVSVRQCFPFFCRINPIAVKRVSITSAGRR